MFKNVYADWSTDVQSWALLCPFPGKVSTMFNFHFLLGNADIMAFAAYLLRVKSALSFCLLVSFITASTSALLKVTIKLTTVTAKISKANYYYWSKCSNWRPFAFTHARSRAVHWSTASSTTHWWTMRLTDERWIPVSRDISRSVR